MYVQMDIGLARLIVQILSWTFPNFQLFNVGDQLVLAGSSSLSNVAVAHITGYACVYVITYIFLAYYNFSRREI